MTFACRTLGAEAGLAAYLLDPSNVSAMGLSSAYADLSVLNTGIVQRSRVQDGTPLITLNYVWKIGGGTAADYQARFQISTGTLSAGSSATGSWISLSSNPGWSVNVSTQNTLKQCTGTLNIRMAAIPNTILATCSVQLSAEANNL